MSLQNNTDVFKIVTQISDGTTSIPPNNVILGGGMTAWDWRDKPNVHDG